jgi:CRISPR-associated endonuclease/helicase Cas3
MNNVPPFAHSMPGSSPGQWQPLVDHLDNVARLAAAFAEPFASSAWARMAGLLHDLGKADSAFQGYLLRENGMDDADYDSGRVNHSSAGAAHGIGLLGTATGRILAYLVAGHHAGLPDWYTSETGHAALPLRLEEGRRNLERIREYAEGVGTRLDASLRPPSFARRPEIVHLWMRMLFSCLVDADFLDTEAFMDPQKAAARAKSADLSELKSRLDGHLAQLAATVPENPVNAARQEILAACRKAAKTPPGMFSLTVPTGGGKTLSSLAFAFDHALLHGKRRVVHVIPYTSIIEQTAAIFAEVLGADNVIEHHCNLDSERETPRARLAAENWDSPVIVTTNVQFFESLYASRPGRCRKLHNLADSVIILDEAQLLPPSLLVPCVDAMNQLVRHYGVTMVLSTATQPALPGIEPPREIIPDPGRLYAALKRVQFNLPVTLSPPTAVTPPASPWLALADQLQSHPQALCIVNTRRDCHDLFRLMPEGTIHLSALMCGEHRTKVIAEIKHRLQVGEPCRVVSTQLVEAGVDIDFPVVYRALAGLDSIAQAAGRCNREGKLGELGQVHVFVPPRPAPPGLLRKGEDTTRELASLADFAPDEPMEYTRYFRCYYAKVNDDGGAWLHERLVKDVQATRMEDSFHLQFRTAASEFNMIDNQAYRPVIVRYRDPGRDIDSDTWIREVRAIGPKLENMRRLQRFTVNVPARLAEGMLRDGLLEEIHPGILAQAQLSLYRDDIGLDVFRQEVSPADLII